MRVSFEKNYSFAPELEKMVGAARILELLQHGMTSSQILEEQTSAPEPVNEEFDGVAIRQIILQLEQSPFIEQAGLSFSDQVEGAQLEVLLTGGAVVYLKMFSNKIRKDTYLSKLAVRYQVADHQKYELLRNLKLIVIDIKSKKGLKSEFELALARVFPELIKLRKLS